MKIPSLLALAIGVLIAATSVQAINSLQDTRNALDQWVETRQITSKEKSDWQLEESILTDTKSLLKNELDRVNETLETLKTLETTADEDRATLAAEEDALAEASAVLGSTIGALETQMKAIIITLPEPLVNKIKPLIRRLPEDSANTKLSLSERIQNIVGILSQADKFNATITTTSESRKISEGKVVGVQTLYWGLAMAYYVDASGTYAGIGFPEENGWKWLKTDGVGSTIQNLLNVYQGSDEIQFVEVPARIN